MSAARPGPARPALRRRRHPRAARRGRLVQLSGAGVWRTLARLRTIIHFDYQFMKQLSQEKPGVSSPTSLSHQMKNFRHYRMTHCLPRSFEVSWQKMLNP
jgi:hypothetical protein